MAGLFSEIEKRLVWNKGIKIPSLDPAVWRDDDYGNRLKYSDHGDDTSPFGWEIDHITPKALGGGDALINLRPLHHSINSGLGGLLAKTLADRNSADANRRSMLAELLAKTDSK